VKENVVELTVVGAGVVSDAAVVIVKSDQSAFAVGFTVMVQRSEVPAGYEPAAVQASVDVDVGSATIVYVCVPVAIAVPPVVSFTATVYVATAPATAVNVNVVELIVEAAGVVSVAVDVSV